MSLKLEAFSAGYRNWETAAVNMEIPSKRLTGLLGPNGSGKSTLLKGMMGLTRHRGSIKLNGLELAEAGSRERARYLAYLPQRHQFTYPISVEEVILMGFNPEMGVFENYSGSQRSKVRTVLAQMGLEALIQSDFTRLSEGQKQRVMLARSLVQEAEVLLLDEPDSALDFSAGRAVLGLVRNLIQKSERCGLVVLHDPGLALKFCDRIELLADGGIVGRIDPGEDSLESIRSKLSLLYGEVELFLSPQGHYALDVP